MYVVRVEGGWNWLRNVTNGEDFDIGGVDASRSATIMLYSDKGQWLSTWKR
jgi:hypothetical protein